MSRISEMEHLWGDMQSLKKSPMLFFFSLMNQVILPELV